MARSFKFLMFSIVLFFGLMAAAESPSTLLTCDQVRSGQPFQVIFWAADNGLKVSAAIPGTIDLLFSCERTGGFHGLKLTCQSTTPSDLGLNVKPDYSARRAYAEVLRNGETVATAWCR